MKNRNSQAVVTEQEVQQALQKFKKQGGLIKKLPDEIVPAHNLVGSRWAMYETIQDNSGPAAGNAAAAESN